MVQEGPWWAFLSTLAKAIPNQIMIPILPEVQCEEGTEYFLKFAQNKAQSQNGRGKDLSRPILARERTKCCSKLKIRPLAPKTPSVFSSTHCHVPQQKTQDLEPKNVECYGMTWNQAHDNGLLGENSQHLLCVSHNLMRHACRLARFAKQLKSLSQQSNASAT
eukprot:563281-Amphidinium_carterae.2